MPELSRLHPLFASQLGLVTRRQLLDGGMTQRSIERWLARGVLVRMFDGVYRHAASPLHEHQLLLAGLLACRGLAGASHRQALGLWNIPLKLPPHPELSVVREAAPRLSGIVVHRSRDLHPDHLTRCRGVVVTTPARTLVDAGQVLDWWDVESCLESMLRARLVTLEQVQAALALHGKRGRRGVGVLRRVLRERALDERPADSALESTFARLCRDAGLPELELHPEVVVDGMALHPDFRFVGTKVFVELDGWSYHGDRQAFERDRQRDQLLTAAGNTVLRFTWRQVIHQPWRVVATLRRVLAGGVLGK